MSRHNSEVLFSAFAVVGAVGFVVDATVFQLLFTLSGGYVLPRLLATAAAIVVTWYLHRRFVFCTSETAAPLAEFLKYVTVQSTGIVTNFSVYFVLLGAFSKLRSIPVVAVAIGALCALAINFIGSRRWAFVGPDDPGGDAGRDIGHD